MRAINATGFTNPWFRTFSEGNKGEALFRFLALQFLLRAYPGVARFPGSVSFRRRRVPDVTHQAIGSIARVTDWLEVNDEDIDARPCGRMRHPVPLLPP